MTNKSSPLLLLFIDNELLFTKDILIENDNVIHTDYYLHFGLISNMRRFLNYNNVQYYAIVDKKINLKPYSNKESLITEFIEKEKQIEKITDIIESHSDIESIGFFVNDPKHIKNIDILDNYKSFFFLKFRHFYEFLDYNIKDNNDGNRNILNIKLFSDDYDDSDSDSDSDLSTETTRYIEMINKKRKEIENQIGYDEKIKNIKCTSYLISLIHKLVNNVIYICKSGIETNNIERFFNSRYIFEMLYDLKKKIEEEDISLVDINLICCSIISNYNFYISSFFNHLQHTNNIFELDRSILVPFNICCDMDDINCLLSDLSDIIEGKRNDIEKEINNKLKIAQ